VSAVIADRERMGFVEQNVLPICSCDSINDICDLFYVLVELQNYEEMPPQSLKHAPTPNKLLKQNESLEEYHRRVETGTFDNMEDSALDSFNS